MRVEKVSGRRGLRRFLEVAKRLYPKESLWVAPLDFERRAFFDPKKNAFFDYASLELFVAVDSSGSDVGRVAAIDNPRYNEFQNTALGFFGFFESTDDPEVAAALLEEAERWVLEHGYHRIHGPVNPSTNHECGILVEGFDLAPVLQMPYNHAYYEKLLLERGYVGVRELLSFHYDVDGRVPERLVRAREALQKRSGFTVRLLNMKDFDAELERVKLVYNEAWSKNFGFVPLTDQEIDCLAHDLKPIIEPPFCQFAEVDGEVAGVSLSLLDYNQLLKPLRGRLFPFGWWSLLTGKRRIDGMRGMVMGVRPRFRKMGIDYAFYHESLMASHQYGLKHIDLSWILAENSELTNAVFRLRAHGYKRHRLYEKELHEKGLA